MMSKDQTMIFLYVVTWAIHISPFIRRWRLPLLRGTEWFFGVRVQPDFYTGPGQRILRRYHMRMLTPFVMEIPLVAAVLIFGHLQQLVWVMLWRAVFIHLNQLFSVDLAERQARPFAAEGAEQPVSSVVLSLTPRKLADYTNLKLELAMAVASLATLVWLLHYYFSVPEHHNLRLVFGGPLVLLYLQAGLLFIKRGIVAWRTPIPQLQAEEHLEAREQARKFYLKVVDWYRILWTAELMVLPLLIRGSAASRDRIQTMMLISLLVVSVILTVWVERRRNALQALAKRARPAKMPELLPEAGSSSGVLCYQPAIPMLLIRSAHGYSLNLANTRTQLGAAYLAGLAGLLVALLRMGH
jgi:hypothetical protein